MLEKTAFPHGAALSTLKVLFVSHYSGRYGANRSLLDLTVQLKSRGVDVLVVLPCAGAIEEDLRVHNIRCVKIFQRIWVKDIGVSFAGLRWLASIVTNYVADVRMFLLARREHVNIIHINSSCTPVGYRSSRWLKVPLIWHIREYLEEDYGLSFYNRTRSLVNISNANRIVAVSKDLAEKYRSLLGGKLGVIYNGVTFPKIPNATILRERTINLLMVGVLDKGKRQLDALRAVAKAKHEYGLNIRLRVVGNGSKEYADFLEYAASEFDIKDCVEFLGYLRNFEDVVAISDVGIICSSREAFGRVTVEAMSAGLLVVASRSGGTCEIVRHGRTGILYETGNATDLAECFVWIDQNRQLAQKLADRGRKHCVKNFNMERVADEVIDMYQECIEGSEQA